MRKKDGKRKKESERDNKNRLQKQRERERERERGSEGGHLKTLQLMAEFFSAIVLSESRIRFPSVSGDVLRSGSLEWKWKVPLERDRRNKVAVTEKSGALLFDAKGNPPQLQM